MRKGLITALLLLAGLWWVGDELLDNDAPDTGRTMPRVTQTASERGENSLPSPRSRLNRHLGPIPSPETRLPTCVWPQQRPDILVEVRDAASGQPIPDAEVIIASIGATLRISRMLWSGYRGNRLWRRVGSSIRTNAHGLIRVPAPAYVGIARCRWGAKAGRIQLNPRPLQNPQVLLLREAKDMEIRVRDQAGHPVSNLLLCIHDRHYEGLDWDDLRTDTRGVARLEGLERLETYGGPHPALQISAGILGHYKPLATFDPANPPHDGLDLVVPATGSMDVFFEHADGTALHPPGSAGPHFANVDSDPNLEDDLPGTTFAIRRRDGVYRLQHVVPGTAVKVSWLTRGWFFNQLIPGPEAPGRRTRRSVRAGQDAVTWESLVLDPDGSPAASRWIRVWTNDVPRGRLRTDPAGRFRVAGTEADAQQARVLVVSDEDFPLQSGALQGSSVTRVTKAPGFHRLAPIQLKPKPLFARGRIVFDQGWFPEAHSLSLLTARAAHRDPITGEFADLLNRILEPKDRAQTHVRLINAHEFEILAPKELRSLGVALKCFGIEDPIAQTVEAGRQDVVIRVPAVATLSALVLHDPGVDWRLLDIELRESGTDRRIAVWSTGHEQALPTMGLINRPIWNGLAPGNYHLRVACLDRELLRLDGIRILGPGSHLDPRLQNIDLRGRLEPVKLRFFRMRDGERTPVSVTGTIATANGEGTRTELQGTSEALLLVADPCDLQLRFEGYQPVRLGGVHADQELILEPR